MNEKIDAELDERPLMVGPPLFVAIAHLNLSWLLRKHFEGQLRRLHKQIAVDELALLGVDPFRSITCRPKIRKPYRQSAKSG